MTRRHSWPSASHGCPVPQTQLRCSTKPLLPDVITGLVPVIHAFLRPQPPHEDGRNKSGHDGLVGRDTRAKSAHDGGKGHRQSLKEAAP